LPYYFVLGVFLTPNFPHFSPENADFTKKQIQFNPIQSQFKPNIEAQRKSRLFGNQSSLITNHLDRTGQKKFFKTDNIKNNILSHCHAKPGRRDMSTSGNKMNTSIENSDFQAIPEKDTVHPGNNEYLHYPFRMNKQGKCCLQHASLIKE